MSGGDGMKFNLNDYEAKDVMHILREWSELDRKEFGHSIGKKPRTIKSYENGTRDYTVQLLKDIAKQYDIDVIFEKRKGA